MKIIKSFFNNSVYLLQPNIYSDNRGEFSETYNKSKFKELGINNIFTQDNYSKSIKKLTFRGIHLQLKPFQQAKLVRVIKGEIIDYIVDLRLKSKSFGQYIKIRISDKSQQIVYVPAGFGHGFLTLKDNTIVNYKVDKKYSRDHAKSINFKDPIININFYKYNTKKFILSKNDKYGLSLKDFKNHYNN